MTIRRAVRAVTCGACALAAAAWWCAAVTCGAVAVGLLGVALDASHEVEP